MSVKSVFSAATVLGLAASVTAGSMYVTSNAAVNQEGIATDETAQNPVVVPELPERPAPLSPEKIRHDRSQEIILDAQGGFAGQLFAMTGVDTTTPGAQLSVRVLQDGALVAETKTDANGHFAVTGLKPGVIGIIARGDAGLLLFGAHLVEATEQKPATLETDLHSALISPDDVSLARGLMRTGIGAEDLRFGKGVKEEDSKYLAGEGDVATSLLSHRVQLGQDGVIRGTVNILDPRTGKNREILDESVYFLQKGAIVSSTQVEHDGAFEVAGLQPGLYSVVGAGKDGVFAVGVEVVGFEAAQAELSKSGYAVVSIQVSLDLAVSPIGANNLNSENFDENLGDNDGSTTPPATPPAGAPAGGGTAGGGGGGGAGGGGGLGALLGAGIGAGLGYLAGNNDNQPSSPGN